MRTIFPDKSQFSLLKIQTCTMDIHGLALENKLVIKALFKISTNIWEDQTRNGFQKSNIKSTQMSITSNSRLNLFHSFWMLISKLTTMEAPKKHQFYKLIKKYSMETITKNISTLGMKLNNSNYTSLSDKLMRTFFPNSLT